MLLDHTLQIVFDPPCSVLCGCAGTWDTSMMVFFYLKNRLICFFINPTLYVSRKNKKEFDIYLHPGLNSVAAAPPRSHVYPLRSCCYNDVT